MTSAPSLSRAGGSRRWRRIRRQVLDRDGWQCQVPTPTADDPDAVCGAFADTCGHVVARHHGGTDDPANLRAECRPHNYGAGSAVRFGSTSVKAPPPPEHYRKAGWYDQPA